MIYILALLMEVAVIYIYSTDNVKSSAMFWSGLALCLWLLFSWISGGVVRWARTPDLFSLASLVVVVGGGLAGPQSMAYPQETTTP
jgi:hypothetical protein